ncbi:caspase-1-like [Achroia grisella]|uniref:caspase-1-like n=1 Tax=Achroia grisella TaxID=688607 RepID=UPI0027D1FA06|nr:caspase-1-like [Achroia grisella]
MARPFSCIEMITENGYNDDFPFRCITQEEIVSDCDNRFLERSLSSIRTMRIGSDYYKMNHQRRGIAVIFNHEVFDDYLNLNNHIGANDVKNLNTVLKELDFEVIVHHNFQFHELKGRLIEMAKNDYSNDDCLLIIILTYGDNGFLYARDTLYRPETLWYNFTRNKCPSLAGKPKLFFIQAYKDDKHNIGTINEKICEIPVQQDFLILFSTLPQNVFGRNSNNGSRFIEVLCKQLRTLATKTDILHILTLVSKKVAIAYDTNRRNDQFNYQWKVPCVSSTLTRLLVFEKKNKKVSFPWTKK